MLLCVCVLVREGLDVVVNCRGGECYGFVCIQQMISKTRGYATTHFKEGCMQAGRIYDKRPAALGSGFEGTACFWFADKRA
jgi:hypothetical protein